MAGAITLQIKFNWSTIAYMLLCFSGVAAAGQVARNECTNPPAGTIFCEDFEGSNPKANFDDYDGNPDTENQLITDPGATGDASNKVIRLRAPAGQSGGADLVKLLPSADRLYVRWFLQYETGFNFLAPVHGGGLAAGDRSFLGSSGNRPNGDDFAYFNLQHDPTARPYAYSYYKGMYQDCPVQGSCYGDSLPCIYDTGGTYCTKAQHRPVAPLPKLHTGRWYCLEEMVDMGIPTSTGTSSNGRLTVWLDGEQYGDFQGLLIRTTPSLKLQSLWLSLFHHNGTHSTAGDLLDNVVVSTRRIGCGGAGQQVSVPAAPTGLSLNP